MSTWRDVPEPELPALNGMGRLRALMRVIPLMVLIVGCLLLLLMLRCFERPLFGTHRPWTPWITVFVCKNALRILGIKLHRTGAPLQRQGALVANHSSWLDIFVLNSIDPLYFVSKAEVANWPGIGWLARATGTVFIRRDRREAKAQTELFQDRLSDGHNLLFFPEGTSTDGLQVLPFKTTLFAAFMAEPLVQDMSVQPISVVYHAPQGESLRFYGWWGGMGFGPHLLTTLAARRQGHVAIHVHAPVKAASFSSRKDLAAACERAIRASHRAARENACQTRAGGL